MSDVERELRDLGDRVGGEVTHGAVPAGRIVRRARVRRSVTVALSAVAIVLVAGIGYPKISELARDEGGRGGLDLAAIAEATELANTARVELEFDMTIDGRSMKTSAVGEIDFEHARSYLVMDEVGSSGRLEMISVGDTAFQRRIGTGDDRSAKWFRLELPDGMPPFAAGSGPADFLDELESMATEVTQLGEEDLDGVRVTHYRAVVDPSGAVDLSSLSDEAEIEVDPMHVWVDELGRLRRMTFGSTLDDGSGAVARMDMTMSLFDFGVPVHIAAPDPEDVTDELEAGEDGSGYVGAGATSGTEFVYGKAGLSGPFLTLSGDDAARLLCVQGGPPGVTRGDLLHEATGRIVASFAAQRDAREYTVICAPPGIGHETVDALLENPNEHTLRLETHHGDEVVVPLRTTAGRS